MNKQRIIDAAADAPADDIPDIIAAYAEAWIATGNPGFRDLLEHVGRSMIDETNKEEWEACAGLDD